MVENFDRMMKDLKSTRRNLEKEKTNSKNKRKDLESQIREGKVTDYKLKISKNKLPKYIDSGLVMPEDLPDNLKNVESKLASQIYEKYDSVFRRGLIEYKPGTKAQRRTKFRAHLVERVNLMPVGEDEEV